MIKIMLGALRFFAPAFTAPTLMASTSIGMAAIGAGAPLALSAQDTRSELVTQSESASRSEPAPRSQATPAPTPAPTTAPTPQPAPTPPPTPASAPPPGPLNLEQRGLARCAAAIALIAGGQIRGEDKALAYPPLTQRGRKFFVRAAAQIMDDGALSPEQSSRLLHQYAAQIVAEGAIDRMMPHCLLMLEASELNEQP